MEELLFSGAVLSCGPQRLRVAWGEPRRSASPGAAHEASVFAPDYFLRDETPWRIYPHSAQMTPEQFRRELSGTGAANPFAWQAQGPAPEAFLASFRRLQERIAAKGLRKGVPVVFETSSGIPDPAWIASRLLNGLAAAEAGGGRLYGFWSSTEGEGMIGVTPEDLFVLWPDGILDTMALAGTARLEEADGLLSDPKEREEHQLVIDDLAQRLSTVGTVAAGETEVVRLAALAHLKTALSARLRSGADFSELVRLLHPTPALGAFPREAGWNWLQSEDASAPVARARFGAPFGWIESGDRICAVAIRNVQWSGGNMLMGSGCGVVSRSDADREWSELALKRQAVCRALGLVRA